MLTISATDSDSGDNGRVTYSMLPLDSFNISTTTGNTIVTIDKLSALFPYLSSFTPRNHPSPHPLLCSLPRISHQFQLGGLQTVASFASVTSQV